MEPDGQAMGGGSSAVKLKNKVLVWRWERGGARGSRCRASGVSIGLCAPPVSQCAYVPVSVPLCVCAHPLCPSLESPGWAQEDGVKPFLPAGGSIP